MTIQIATLCGSVRPGNYTSIALALVVDELRQNPDLEVIEINPEEISLPLPGQPARDDSVTRMRQIIQEATGVVIATPEYHGSFSSVIKLAIENMGFPSALRGKPVALLGVAGGRIGAIKSLEHLRSVCSHVGALVLPGLVSIARVRDVFDAEGNPRDPQTEQLVRGLGRGLLQYIQDAICPKLTLEAMVRSGAGKQA